MTQEPVVKIEGKHSRRLIALNVLGTLVALAGLTNCMTGGSLWLTLTAGVAASALSYAGIAWGMKGSVEDARRAKQDKRGIDASR